MHILRDTDDNNRNSMVMPMKRMVRTNVQVDDQCDRLLPREQLFQHNIHTLRTLIQPIELRLYSDRFLIFDDNYLTIRLM